MWQSGLVSAQLKSAIRGKGFECLALEDYALNWKAHHAMLTFLFP